MSGFDPPLFSLCLPPSLSQCDKEIEQVQSQLEEYKEPPLSLSRLSLKQQKFKTFRETANVSVNIHSQAFAYCSLCFSLFIFKLIPINIDLDPPPWVLEGCYPFFYRSLKWTAFPLNFSFCLHVLASITVAV